MWALIDMSEKTRKHCMMLENCVYDFFEMKTLAMAQAGAFGEVVHVEGAYHHCLDPYWREYWDSWRLEYNKENRGDVYPTHGIGPVCQVLNIHRGDRMKTLVSMDTKQKVQYKNMGKYKESTGLPMGEPLGPQWHWECPAIKKHAHRAKHGATSVFLVLLSIQWAQGLSSPSACEALTSPSAT